MRFIQRKNWLVMAVSPNGKYYVHRRCWTFAGADACARDAQGADDDWSYFVRHRTELRDRTAEPVS